MALWRAAGLCRLALRTQFAAVRLLSAVGTGGEAPSGEDKRRRVNLEALRRERPPRPPAQRTQPEPPRKGYRRPWATHEQLQLNKAIQECPTAEAVLDLVAANQAILSAVNAATALTRASKLVGKRDAAWLSGNPRFAQLMQAAESLLGSMGAQELSNTLYACGLLGVALPPGWLQRYWDASAAKLGAFKPQELSNTLYASGKLGIVPPADWLLCYWDASAVKLGEFKPQELSVTLYAASQLGVAPPADWLQRYWDALCLSIGDFKPQNFSNTLYACSQLGITPSADWLQRFWGASSALLGSFKSQELSNTLHACGKIRIKPNAGWLQGCWDASALKLGEFKPQELSNTLYACAELGIVPPDSWLQRFSAAYEQALPDSRPQELANTALALATLGLWKLQLWPALWDRLCHTFAHDVAGWDAGTHLHGRQLYQAYTAAEIEQPGLLSAPSRELLAASRQSWVERARQHQTDGSSKLHGGVSAYLTRMGIAHANGRWCERAERTVDIAIDGDVPVALEVDGPTHFLQDGGPVGSSVLRNRLLSAHGWRVLVVDYRVWDALKTPVLREEHLRRLLA